MPPNPDRDKPTIPLEYQPPAPARRRATALVLYVGAWVGVLVGLACALLGIALRFDNSGFATVLAFDLDTIVRKSIWTADSIALLGLSLWTAHATRPRR
jgi:hypothetical protein